MRQIHTQSETRMDRAFQPYVYVNNKTIVKDISVYTNGIRKAAWIGGYRPITII